MAKIEKRYVITAVKGTYTRREYKSSPMTVAEAVAYYTYTLEAGASYSYEKGNTKINLAPKTIASLITNLNAASNNAARNGCGCYFIAEEAVETCVDTNSTSYPCAA